MIYWWGCNMKNEYSLTINIVDETGDNSIGGQTKTNNKESNSNSIGGLVSSKVKGIGSKLAGAFAIASVAVMAHSFISTEYAIFEDTVQTYTGSSLLTQKINYAFSTIKNYSNPISAFTRLMEIQKNIATINNLKFKENQRVSFEASRAGPAFNKSRSGE